MGEHQHQIAYRYEGCAYSLGVDEFDNTIPGARIDVHLREFRVVATTPKGFWVSYGFGNTKDRFVLLSARKRFACLSKEDAGASFLARKKRQISILESQLQRAKEELSVFLRKEHEDA